MRDLNIIYVVACYLGERRAMATTHNGDTFIKKHIETVNRLDDKIKKIVFSVNIDSEEDKDKVETIVKENASEIPVEVIFNPNEGFSYRAWDIAIKKHLMTDVDYFFLIEDDYLPVENFCDVFLEKFDSNTCYVCQKRVHEIEAKKYADRFKIPIFKWAAVSNGMLSAEISRKIFKETGQVFQLVPGKLYSEGETNQRHFMQKFTERKFTINDIADVSRVEFYSHKKGLLILGNPKAASHIRPIVDHQKMEKV